MTVNNPNLSFSNSYYTVQLSVPLSLFISFQLFTAIHPHLGSYIQHSYIGFHHINLINYFSQCGYSQQDLNSWLSLYSVSLLLNRTQNKGCYAFFYIGISGD